MSADCTASLVVRLHGQSDQGPVIVLCLLLTDVSQIPLK